ncbi:ASCH domain-containing protein [Halobacillus sp. Marseille-Q1614]|uniref:ASCH domain-containing protein n=1 Tax=Halobacillus sp. Marseille-Q1614 TaxID=2709134 RepID=UPI00156F3180|nr:ASCH domain-containing protein [Halobacillus sp. Marseille-Q1614]
MVKKNEYSNKSYFGWENDNGIGEKLINQIKKGQKTATCSPKELYGEEELKELLAMKDQYVTVMDKFDNPRCNIHIIDIFETSFGNPDPRLIEGESVSNGNNVDVFKQQHRRAWKEEIEEGFILNDDTILIVELFKLIN